MKHGSRQAGHAWNYSGWDMLSACRKQPFKGSQRDNDKRVEGKKNFSSQKSNQINQDGRTELLYKRRSG